MPVRGLPSSKFFFFFPTVLWPFIAFSVITIRYCHGDFLPHGAGNSSLGWRLVVLIKIKLLASSEELNLL